MAGLALRDALRAAALAEQARAALSAAQDAEELGEVLPALQGAEDDLAEAVHVLDRPAPRLVAAVPLAGRSLRAERAVVVAARSGVQAAEQAAEAAGELRGTGGSIDLAVLERLAQELSASSARAREDLRRLRAVPTGLTPGIVRDAVVEAEAALEPVVTALGRAAEGAQVAHGLLGGDGPRTLLIALQNNAELRGTGGYVSSYALWRTEEGRVSPQPFRDVLDVNDPPGSTRTVPAPADYVEDYGPYLADTTLFRNWTMSPDVPVAAEVAADVAGLLLPTRPDAVLLLDVPALAALLDLAQERVRLDGREVSGDQLVEALLVDSYSRAGETSRAQDARRLALQQAAGRAVERLLGADVAPSALVREAARLARGRHLALWSDVPEEQAALRRLGLSGAVSVDEGDLLMVSANNLNANKLDQYVRRSVAAEVTVAPGSAEVVQRVTLVNRAPQDLVPYVAGDDEPGVARERVELSLGPEARVTSVTVDGEPARGSVRHGPGRTRVAVFVRLVRDAPVTVEVAYDLPLQDGTYRLELLPQPLVQDAELDVIVRPVAGERLGRVEGAEVQDGAARLVGPFDAQHVLEVALQGPDPGPTTPVERWQRWWDEPLSLTL